MKNDFFIIFWFIRPYKIQVSLIFLLIFFYSILDTVSIGAFYPFIHNLISSDITGIKNGGKLLTHITSIVYLLPIDDEVVASSFLLLLFVFASNFFGFFAESITSWYRYKLYASFLNKIYQKLINNQYRFFHEKKQGELLYVGMNASQSVGEMLLYFPKVGTEIFRILAILILLFSISVKIFLIIIGIIIIFGLLVHNLSRKVIQPIAVALQNAQSELTSVFSETIAGIKQIKIFNGMKYWYERFNKLTFKTRMLSTQNIVYGSIPARIIQIVGVSAVVASIVYVRSYKPDYFQTFLPILSVYILSLQRLMAAVSNIGKQWLSLKSLAPRLRITYETLAEKKYDLEIGANVYPGLKNEIQLRNLSFAYLPGIDLIKNLNITIPKGKSIAIVGGSGAGKSTLIDIIIQLYKPKEGNIFIDGIDYSEFALSDWLKSIGLVSQDTFIFNESVNENIKVGKINATQNEIIHAAKIANAHSFIKKLPKGYETIVGDRGLKLSGGQRQRIAIARAIIKKPDILILDEATSALDNISEKVVQDALKKAGANRTNIIIAHRLSTIEHVDNIIVLDNGCVVEEGSHSELLKKKGYYFQLYNKNQVVKNKK